VEVGVVLDDPGDGDQPAGAGELEPLVELAQPVAVLLVFGGLLDRLEDGVRRAVGLGPEVVRLQCLADVERDAVGVDDRLVRRGGQEAAEPQEDVRRRVGRAGTGRGQDGDPAGR
jgi:hypothetical protein